MSKKILFLAAFVALGFGAMQVPFSQLLGAQNLKFSLFDFYGPIAGAFFSSAIGLITVFVMQLINWAWHGFATDAGTIIRFFQCYSLCFTSPKNRAGCCLFRQSL